MTVVNNAVTVHNNDNPVVLVKTAVLYSNPPFLI